MRKTIVLILVCLLLTWIPASAEEEPIGTLIIPALRLYKPIEFIPLIDKNYDLTELGYGVGFLEGTSWEDSTWGRTVLVGHTPGGFSTLDKLQNDAILYILTNNFILIYQVNGAYLTTPDDVDVLAPTNTPTLVLMTCANGTAQRLIVTAYLKEYHAYR